MISSISSRVNLASVNHRCAWTCDILFHTSMYEVANGLVFWYVLRKKFSGMSKSILLSFDVPRIFSVNELDTIVGIFDSLHFSQP